MNGVIGLLVFVIITRELENGTEPDLVQILPLLVAESEFRLLNRYYEYNTDHSLNHVTKNHDFVLNHFEFRSNASINDLHNMYYNSLKMFNIEEWSPRFIKLRNTL